MTEHIVFLDAEGLAPGVRVTPPPFPHNWTQHSYTEPEELVERLRGATVAMTCSVPLRREHLEQLPNLRMISLALTGTDIVDVDYCAERGIVVTNVPGYAANTVAEHTLAMIFELLRRPSAYTRLMRRVHRGETEARNIYFDFRIRDLAGKTLGILGSGPIAMRLGDKARALGMRTVYENRGGRMTGPEHVSLDTLLETSDIVSINCPLTDETRNLLGAERLAQMKPDAILVNTGRGGIVNEAALIAAMQAGRLGGAALDVVVNEPVQPDDPLFALIERDDFILNPHVAWSSEDAMQTLISGAIDNITRFVNERSALSAR
jgi:glycerate dehydrogenase